MKTLNLIRGTITDFNFPEQEKTWFNIKAKNKQLHIIIKAGLNWLLIYSKAKPKFLGIGSLNQDAKQLRKVLINYYISTSSLYLIDTAIKETLYIHKIGWEEYLQRWEGISLD